MSIQQKTRDKQQRTLCRKIKSNAILPQYLTICRKGYEDATEGPAALVAERTEVFFLSPWH